MKRKTIAQHMAVFWLVSPRREILFNGIKPSIKEGEIKKTQWHRYQKWRTGASGIANLAIFAIVT